MARPIALPRPPEAVSAAIARYGPLVVLALAGCSSDTSSTVGGSSSAPAATELTVFAGSSLTKGFTAIGADFEAAHPGVTVTFNFGPSDGLAAQIESEGGAADYSGIVTQLCRDDR